MALPHEQAPIIALLQEIRTQLPWYAKALNTGSKLASVSIQSALMAMEDLTKKIGISASKIQAVGEKWEQERFATALPSHAIREHLNLALNQLLGKSKGKARRLVILVDDLDRCEPESAFKLLEGIKIYLNLPSCVFVLGMNQEIIEGAIAAHFGKEQKDVPPPVRAHRAREYLEKLCNEVWHLPFHETILDLVGEWLQDHPLRQELGEVLVSSACLPPNPRKIKGFGSVLQRCCFQNIAQAKKADSRERLRMARLTVLISVLYHFHYDLYRIVSWEPQFYELLREWANGRESNHPALAGLDRRQVPEADASQTTPTPRPGLISAFPDPARGNVLRVQLLMNELGVVPEAEIAEVSFQVTAVPFHDVRNEDHLDPVRWQLCPPAAVRKDFVNPFNDHSLIVYYDELFNWHGYIRFLGLSKLKENPDVLLESLFVEPNLSASRVLSDLDPGHWPPIFSSIEAIVKHPWLVLLGDTGVRQAHTNQLADLAVQPSGREPVDGSSRPADSDPDDPARTADRSRHHLGEAVSGILESFAGKTPCVVD